MPLDDRLTDKASHALYWIVEILNRKNIPFQISGGLAAKLYGSPRPLKDIDLDIPEDRFAEIIGDVRPYIIQGPENYKDERWHLYLMVLNYRGQDIDIGSSNVKIHDDNMNIWRDFLSDLKDVVYMDAAGIRVPVIPKKDLIAYKKLLAGDHQKEDIQAIS
jgi:hypothetical protein